MRKNKGFTLIELLIVLTILAILVAVVAISLTTFVGKGKTEACKTDQRTLQSAVVAFYSEAGYWPADFPTNEIIVWAKSDGSATGKFVPTYVVDKPDSADANKCNWSIEAESGVVYAAPAGPADADRDNQCACWAKYPNPSP